MKEESIRAFEVSAQDEEIAVAPQRRGWRGALARVPTWVWEQAVLCALLATAMVVQVRQLGAGITRKEACLIASQALLVLLGQKARSIADRQLEANRRAGVREAQIECHRKQRLVAGDVQAIGLVVGFIAATTWAHALIAMYIFVYPMWRALYRDRQRSRRRAITVDQLADELVAPSEPPRGAYARLFQRLLGEHDRIVLHVVNDTTSVREIAARLAKELLDQPTTSALVVAGSLHDARRVQTCVTNLVAAADRIVAVSEGSNVLGSRFDRACVIYDGRRPVDEARIAWLRTCVLGRCAGIATNGRLTIVWARQDPIPDELANLGPCFDLRVDGTDSPMTQRDPEIGVVFVDERTARDCAR